VFRHPSIVFKHFEDEFINVIKSFKTNQKYLAWKTSILIMGRLLTTQQNISDYVNHISSIGCTQLINKPTKVSQVSSSIIDHM